MSVLSQWIEQKTQDYKDNMEPLTEENFAAWRKTYLMDALMGLRYGQSFCNHFNVEDYILYYMRDAASAHQYIKENYLQGKNNDLETNPRSVCSTR